MTHRRDYHPFWSFPLVRPTIYDRFHTQMPSWRFLNITRFGRRRCRLVAAETIGRHETVFENGESDSNYRLTAELW